MTVPKHLQEIFLRLNAQYHRCKLLSFLLLFAHTVSSAQITQSARFEKEKKNSEQDFTVVSMGERGIAILRDRQKYERGEQLWELVLLDTALQETWAKELVIENRFRLIGHEYRDETLYYLFREGDTEQGKLKIVKVDFKVGQTEEHIYEPELSVRLTHFNVVGNQVVLAGYVASQPTVLMYDLSNHHAKIIPGLLLNNAELLDVRNNVNNTFNVVIAERESKFKKRIISKTFDQAGAMLLDDVIEVDPDKEILTGSTSTLVRDELMIVGTWGEGTTKQASGIFTVMVDPYADHKIKYYDFAQLSHFLDYLKPKAAAKTKAKADSRRKLGKIPDFKVAVLPTRLEETKNGFLFYMQAYYSTGVANNNQWNSPPFGGYPYSPYGYNPYRRFNSLYGYPFGFPYTMGPTNNPETKMLLGSLVVLDARGELIADHGYKLDNLKIISPEQISDFICAPTKCTQVYAKGNEIRYQVNQLDGVTLMDETATMQGKLPTDNVQSDNDEIALSRFWYGSFIYIFGNQTVRNAEGGRRDVFFINKIKIE